MALVPKFELEIKNTCDKVDVWEMTNAYSGGNLTGWGAPNIDTTAIITADIKIYDHTGVTLLQTIVMYGGTTDVYTSATGAPTPSTFKAFTDTSWAQPDGIYKAIYTVLDGVTEMVSADQWCLFTCNLCNCMESLLLKMSELCPGDKLDKYKEVYDRLEVLKYAVEAAHVSCDFATATALLAEANTLCTTFSDCGCNDC